MSVDPSTLYFSEEHEWVALIDENTARIGITDYAQQQLGDVVFVENPQVDDEVKADEEMGVVESVKSVSDIFAPVSGTVIRVNEEVETSPELVNESPFDKGWLVEVRMSDRSELERLLSEEAYRSYTGSKED